jgi:hypothetical protein
MRVVFKHCDQSFVTKIFSAFTRGDNRQPARSVASLCQPGEAPAIGTSPYGLRPARRSPGRPALGVEQPSRLLVLLFALRRVALPIALLALPATTLLLTHAIPRLEPAVASSVWLAQQES